MWMKWSGERGTWSRAKVKRTTAWIAWSNKMLLRGSGSTRTLQANCFCLGNILWKERLTNNETDFKTVDRSYSSWYLPASLPVLKTHRPVSYIDNNQFYYEFFWILYYTIFICLLPCSNHWPRLQNQTPMAHVYTQQSI